MSREYIVKITYEYVVEAEDEEDATEKAWLCSPIEAVDVYTEEVKEAK